MFVFIIYLYCFSYYTRAFRDSFRCLILPRLSLGYTIILDLTFNCKKFRITESGCLEKLQVKYTTAKVNEPVYLDLKGNPNHNLKKFIYSFKESDLFTIEAKNYYLENIANIKKKKQIPPSFSVGIPIPSKIYHRLPFIDDQFLLNNQLFAHNIPTTSLFSYLPVTYDVHVTGVQSIYIKGQQETSFHCEKLNNSEPVLQNKKATPSTLNSLLDEKSIKFEEYRQFFDTLEIEQIYIKPAVIIFGGNFLQTIEKIIKKAKNENKLQVGILQTINSNFSFIILKDHFYGLHESNPRIKKQLYYSEVSKLLQSMYDLKEMDKKGTKLLNKRHK